MTEKTIEDKAFDILINYSKGGLAKWLLDLLGEDQKKRIIEAAQKKEAFANEDNN